MDSEIANIENILFVEDDPSDVKLTLEALQASYLVNRVVVVTDGVEAIEHLGIFWSAINEPPVGEEEAPVLRA